MNTEETQKAKKGNVVELQGYATDSAEAVIDDFKAFCKAEGIVSIVLMGIGPGQKFVQKMEFPMFDPVRMLGVIELCKVDMAEQIINSLGHNE